MVVLVGSSHVRGRVGIPDRFTQRANLTSFTMVPAPWTAVGKPVGEARLGASEADWVLYARPQARDGLSLVTARGMSSAAIFI